MGNVASDLVGLLGALPAGSRSVLAHQPSFAPLRCEPKLGLQNCGRRNSVLVTAPLRALFQPIGQLGSREAQHARSGGDVAVAALHCLPIQLAVEDAQGERSVREVMGASAAIALS